VLTVVNTKSQARKLYTKLAQGHPDWHIVHLSANMCPAHRRKILGDSKNVGTLKEYLADKTTRCVCISTRLIEAGVDIDFDSAIRFLAGFDSIIQTAGRCNRNGNLRDAQGNPIPGKTYIINIVKEDEKISKLKDLIKGQEIMQRLIGEYKKNEAQFDHTLLHPDLISLYFLYFYGQISEDELKHKVAPGRKDTVLDLLSDNTKSVQAYGNTAISRYGEKAKVLTQFCQSFETAWKHFEVIAEETVGVIVPYAGGKKIIGELSACPDTERLKTVLLEAQQYSVNIYFSDLKDLQDAGIVKQVSGIEKMEIYTVNSEHYDADIGIRHECGSLDV
jgi:CRISPR-associated endonuclease/helicase Cas3